MFWVVYLIMLSFTASSLSIGMKQDEKEKSRKACKCFLLGVLITATICHFWHGFNEMQTVLFSIILPIVFSLLARAAEKFK